VDDAFLAALSNRLMWLARGHGDPGRVLAEEMGMRIPDNRMQGWLQQARDQGFLAEAPSARGSTSRGTSGGVLTGAHHTIVNLSFGPCGRAGGVLTRTCTGDFVYVGDVFGVSGKVSYLNDTWAISQLTLESDHVPVGSLARRLLPTGDILRGAAAADLTEEPPRFVAPNVRVMLTDEFLKGLADRLIFLGKSHRDGARALAEESGMEWPSQRIRRWVRAARDRGFMPLATNGRTPRRHGGLEDAGS
jgi:hypothetical protein